jgi:hypothetical protein
MAADDVFAEAEHEFRQAMDIARNQSARLFKIQSCNGLASLSMNGTARSASGAVHCWPSASPARSAASELCALDVADLTETPDDSASLSAAARLTRMGKGPRGQSACCRLRPVEAVQTWLAAAEICAGPC